MRGGEARIGQAEGAGADSESARMLRMSRGFSCLFWSLPVLAAAHAVALLPVLSIRAAIGMLLLGFLPLLCGLWRLRLCGALTARWGRRLGGVAALAFAAMYLCPFPAWWRAFPMQGYLAANMVAHYLVTVGLLAGLNRMAAEAAQWMEDATLHREALAGMGMVWWLSGCTLAALAWLFHRAGLWAAGWTTVLEQAAQLPGEARYLLLLPYAMTAYVMWRTKESGFQRAGVRSGLDGEDYSQG